MPSPPLEKLKVRLAWHRCACRRTADTLTYFMHTHVFSHFHSRIFTYFLSFSCFTRFAYSRLNNMLSNALPVRHMTRLVKSTKAPRMFDHSRMFDRIYLNLRTHTSNCLPTTLVRISAIGIPTTERGIQSRALTTSLVKRTQLDTSELCSH